MVNPLHLLHFSSQILETHILLLHYLHGLFGMCVLPTPCSSYTHTRLFCAVVSGCFNGTVRTFSCSTQRDWSPDTCSWETPGSSHRLPTPTPVWLFGPQFILVAATWGSVPSLTVPCSVQGLLHFPACNHNILNLCVPLGLQIRNCLLLPFLLTVLLGSPHPKPPTQVFLM